TCTFTLPILLSSINPCQSLFEASCAKASRCGHPCAQERADGAHSLDPERHGQGEGADQRNGCLSRGQRPSHLGPCQVSVLCRRSSLLLCVRMQPICMYTSLDQIHPIMYSNLCVQSLLP